MRGALTQRHGEKGVIAKAISGLTQLHSYTAKKGVIAKAILMNTAARRHNEKGIAKAIW